MGSSLSAGKVQVWRCSVGGTTPEPVMLGVQVANLDQATLLLPAGAYTTLRTYQRWRVLHLEDHFRRLEESALLAGQPVQLDRPHLRQALRRAVQAYPAAEEVRLRLVLDLHQEPGTLYICVQALTLPPAQVYQNGVAAVTCTLQRNLPKAKLTDFIPQATQARQSLPPGANEALLVDEQGYILEGSSSNFFAVKEGTLYTAEQGVLDGITRRMVLRQIERLRLPLVKAPISRADLPRLSEAFITSASRGVLPVVRIDDQIIGDGRVGPLTKTLMQAYSAALEAELEPL